MKKLTVFQASPARPGKPFSCCGARSVRLHGRWRTSAVHLIVLMLLVAAAVACSGKMDPDTVAVVNGRIIDKRALELAQRPWSELDATDEQRMIFQSRAINQLIDEALILQDAERLGLAVGNKELKKQLDFFMSDYSEPQFKEMLIKEYVNLDELREQMRRNMLIRKVTEVRVKEREQFDSVAWNVFFRERLEEDSRRFRLKVAHITFENKEGAEAALARLRSGSDFDAIAGDLAKNSNDVSIGNPVWVTPHFEDKGLSRILSGLADGEISDIIETQMGYSIFQVLESDRNSQTDPKAFLSSVYKEYEAAQRARAYAEWIRELRDESDISVNPIFSYENAGKRDTNEKKVEY